MKYWEIIANKIIKVGFSVGWISALDDDGATVWFAGARPAKDFESWETVSIAESAQCPLVRCPAQLVNHESTRMNTNHKSIGVRPGSTGRWPVGDSCQLSRTSLKSFCHRSRRSS